MKQVVKTIMIEKYYEKGIIPESIKEEVIEYVNKTFPCVQRWIALNRLFPTWRYCPRVNENPYLVKDLERAQARLKELEGLVLRQDEEEIKDWLEQHKEKNLTNFFKPQEDFPGAREMMKVHTKVLGLVDQLDTQQDPILEVIKTDLMEEVKKCVRTYCIDRQTQPEVKESPQYQIAERLRLCRLSVESRKQAIEDDKKQVAIDNKQLEILYKFIKGIS